MATVQKSSTPAKAAHTKAALAKVAAKAAAKQAASPLPTVAAPVAPAAPAKPAHGMPVAVRIGAQYRCAAPHTQARWAAIVAACNAGNGTAQVAALQAGLQAGAQAHNYAGPGVPGHFLGYCLRKGYLLAAA